MDPISKNPKCNLPKILEKLILAIVIAFVILALMFGLLIGFGTFLLAKDFVESITLKKGEIHSSTLSSLKSVEKEIVPIIENEKVTGFVSDGFMGCDVLVIDGKRYSVYFPGDCFGNGKEIAGHNLDVFKELEKYDISRLEVENTVYGNMESDFVYIEFIFLHGLKSDKLYYIPDEQWVLKNNKMENPNIYYDYYEKIQDNWYVRNLDKSGSGKN